MERPSLMIPLAAAAALSGCSSTWNATWYEAVCFEDFGPYGQHVEGVQAQPFDYEGVYDSQEGLDLFTVDLGIDSDEAPEEMRSFYSQNFRVALGCSENGGTPNADYGRGENFRVIPDDEGNYSENILVDFGDYLDCDAVYLSFLYEDFESGCPRPIWTYYCDLDGDDCFGYYALEYRRVGDAFFKFPVDGSLIYYYE